MVEDGFDDATWVHMGGTRRVHVRDHCRGAKGRAEKREKGEAGEVDIARPDAVFTAQNLCLCAEDLVCVLDPFRRAGASRREENGRQVTGGDGRYLKWSSYVVKLVQGRASPEESSAEGDGDGNTAEGSATCQSQDMRRGDADQGFGFGLTNTAHEPFPSHTGIDEYRDRSDLEERKSEGEEIERWTHHEKHTRSLLDSRLPQTMGEAVASFVQLRKRKVGV